MHNAHCKYNVPADDYRSFEGKKQTLIACAAQGCSICQEHCLFTDEMVSEEEASRDGKGAIKHRLFTSLQCMILQMRGIS